MQDITSPLFLSGIKIAIFLLPILSKYMISIQICLVTVVAAVVKLVSSINIIGLQRSRIRIDAVLNLFLRKVYIESTTQHSVLIKDNIEDCFDNNPQFIKKLKVKAYQLV